MIQLALWIGCGTPEVEAPPAPEPDVAAVPSAPAQPGLLTEVAFAALHELRTDEAPPLQGTAVTIGGTTGYLSLPKGVEGPVPGVIVVHEWWGLNDHIRHWADRLATQGYAALAVDLYGGTVATTREEAMAAMKGVDEAAALTSLLAAHTFLTTDPRVQAPRTASIGWCFGGGWSLQLALAEPELDAAVMYYGRLVNEPGRLKALQAPLLGIFGEQDQGIPVADVQAFEASLVALDKSVEVHIYNAPHAFANPSSARYDAESASQAWSQVQAFLDAELTP